MNVICKSCGQSVPNSKFCINCGSPLAVGRSCYNCGSPVGENQKFCGECNAPLQNNGYNQQNYQDPYGNNQYNTGYGNTYQQRPPQQHQQRPQQQGQQYQQRPQQQGQQYQQRPQQQGQQYQQRPPQAQHAHAGSGSKVSQAGRITSFLSLLALLAVSYFIFFGDFVQIASEGVSLTLSPMLYSTGGIGETSYIENAKYFFEIFSELGAEMYFSGLEYFEEASGYSYLIFELAYLILPIFIALGVLVSFIKVCRTPKKAYASKTCIFPMLILFVMFVCMIVTVYGEFFSYTCGLALSLYICVGVTILNAIIAKVSK